MIDNTIAYKSIIMRCDRIDKSAYAKPDSGVEIVFFKPGMELDWAEVQKGAGEFADCTEAEVISYFTKRFGVLRKELEQRCIFLKEKETENYIGTCIAWFEPKREETVPVLHWLAVKDAYANCGYGRVLVTEAMNIFETLDSGQKIYLHTQPCSYKAIKLYNDFGFCMTETDTYGTAVNEYTEAMPILEKYMTDESYKKLLQTSVL